MPALTTTSPSRGQPWLEFSNIPLLGLQARAFTLECSSMDTVAFLRTSGLVEEVIT